MFRKAICFHIPVPHVDILTNSGAGCAVVVGEACVGVVVGGAKAEPVGVALSPAIPSATAATSATTRQTKTTAKMIKMFFTVSALWGMTTASPVATEGRGEYLADLLVDMTCS